jgi:integral membrane sensor domain MASE1
VVDAIEGILNVAVLSWCLRRQVTFARLRDFSALLFCGAIGANGVAALGGASVFHFFAGATFWPSWWMWWLSNGIGILVVTPCIVSWVNLKLHWRHPVRPSRWIEAITVALVLAAVAMIVFEGVTVYSLVLPYLTFPLLIWAALRLGVPGASTGALILASIAVWSTAHDLGPFAFASGTVYSKLLQVQSFIAAALACSLVPAIVIEIYGKGNMPVLLDDCFAMYDDDRVMAALHALTESTKGQIILFTCHKREKELMDQQNMKYHYINLSDLS